MFIIKHKLQDMGISSRAKMLIHSALLVLILSSAISMASSDNRLSREEYITKYSPIAVSLMQRTGVPASVTLAQGILESDGGNSPLARYANNHFGIKCHDWEGNKFKRNENGRQECYRSYDDAESSYRDHADFLRYRDRYASLFNLEPTDYKGWAYGLKSAGYAEDAEYPKKLIRVIEQYGLASYDNIEKKQVPPPPAEVEAPVVFKPEKKNSAVYRISLEREVFKRNGVACIEAFGGETYASLAEEYGMFRGELLRFNDLGSDRIIAPGTVVYLEKKKKNSAKYLDKHVFEEGDTMYDISQRYAVRLKALYRNNPGIRPGTQPQPGAVILLRKDIR